jgi:HlyD family secretion protein
MPVYYWRLGGLAVCLTTAILVAGCEYGGGKSSSADRQRQQTPAVPVKAVMVVEQTVERTTLQPATVHPYFKVEIQPKVSGYVKQLQVDIGDFVEAGDILAVIDVPEMEKQRQIIQAQIKRFESEEKRAEAGVELAEANIQSVKAKLLQAKSEMGRARALMVAAEAEFTRTADLVEKKSIASRVLDEVRKKRDSELANQDSVQAAIYSAEANVTVAEASRDSADADLEVAKSETEISRKELEELDVLVAYATLKAPFAGVVTLRNVNPGDLVRAEDNDRPLFVVSQVDKLRVHIPVPEVEAALVDRGDPVSLTFPSFEGEAPVSAEVTRLSGSLDPSTRTMLVEVEIENVDGKLLPGMFGQASITLNANIAANMLPARAVRFDESGRAYVYVVDQTETVSIVNVTTGIDDGRRIEIRSGIDAGQRVVDAHLNRFTNGQQVRILTP